MYIQNRNALSVTNERKDILDILEAGLSAVRTESVAHSLVSLENQKVLVEGEDITPEEGGRLFLFGVGKCARKAVFALENILGEHVYGGAVLDVSEVSECPLTRVECFVGTHPLPSEANVEASKRIAELLKETTEKDVVLFVVSGGGSTLLCLPQEGSTCLEEEDIMRVLMHSGAPIEEMNTVRKHLSELRGGNVARLAYPSRVFALIFSDVPGDDIRTVASGPTVHDETTAEDAAEVLTRYHVLTTCGMDHCGLIETTKEEKYFEKVKNILAVSNTHALSAMKTRGEKSGYTAQVCSSCLTGEAKEVARDIAERLHTAPSGTLLLYGGETTVVVKDKTGKGGRNQELALSALRCIHDDEVVVAFASDGRDHTETAGAIADYETRKKAETLGLSVEDALKRNRSYEFFIQTDAAIVTGETGINVSDLTVAVKAKQE